ncbi:murein L,D-transpeptidase [Thalassovita autumnalis]|uniref:Murein L,D-transpeptidase n=1 Tax=Thalassovita autumnalis TaxID=2072972 RepID=A0A0N7LVB3_9RHOB|nr:L,D-transpeptidase family protein [Thalassovita autumnalis]CUH65818.1 murein L,D-transpeptidase [Thalassovita autumnalis]CUH70688.1 murein L,D-transpeptidase [Thalassovita autumnalis]
MQPVTRSGFFRFAPRLTLGAVAACLMLAQTPTPAAAQVTAFKQAVAETASDDRELARFYRENGFGGIWTGEGAEFVARRQALINVLQNVRSHGLPQARYDVNALLDMMRNAKTPRDLGIVDVELSKAYLKYARDVAHGVLIPGKIDDGLVRKISKKDGAEYLEMLVTGQPAAVMKQLPPASPEYPRLRKEMLRLQGVIARGGWGETVPGKKLEPGDRGASIVKLRNRLMALGYLDRSATQIFDTKIQAAVQQFQADHGLAEDGVAGATTLKELNVSAETRLQSVIVAMERERWTNFERGERHIWVNLTDYTAKIVDDGKVTFRTRSVIGANSSDRRSPEFSDTMEHMVINPTWNVPRSIAVKEYLPQLKKNPNAVSHLRLIDGAGRTVSREGADFTQFSATNFPFDIKQPPSSRNALGLVKFMFPNRHNIYLHDTPQKALFSRETRAFSHGCIRLHQPFDFAYALLARQDATPKETFQRILKTGRETQVDLEQHLPVHIVYRTAVVPAKGKANYRRDTYGRDAKIWKALQSAGVALGSVRG